MSTNCVCCTAGVGPTPHRNPLCDACVKPGEAKSYCAKCGDRRSYPFDDFVRVMSAHYPEFDFAKGTVVRLPACAKCKDDGKPSVGDRVLYYGIEFN